MSDLNPTRRNWSAHAEAARRSAAVKLSQADEVPEDRGAGAAERQEALVYAVLAVSYELAALVADRERGRS